MRILTAIIMILVATVALGESDYYVWVDENGVTNYSERNPQGVDAQHISRTHRFGERVESGRPGAVPEAPAQETETSSERSSTTSTSSTPPVNDDVAAEERAAIMAKIDETKRANCEIGKRNLAQLEAFARVKVTGEDGQQRVLSEQEHAQQLQEARQLIAENC